MIDPNDAEPDALFERIEELARAQCDAAQIGAALRVEFQLPADAILAFLEWPAVVGWLDACALAGQAGLQARMWQVADQCCDQPVGAKMAQWLSRNYLGHSGSDVSTEIKALLAELKGDPAGHVEILDRALALVGGGRA